MESQTPQFDPEEFWDDLLAFVEAGRVIPIVGGELLTIEDGETTRSLYRVVATRLLNKYRSSALPVPEIALRDGRELNDAVCALVAGGKRVKDLYRPIHDILQQVLASHPTPSPGLRQLAEIRDFDLFATTTPDDLLARTVDVVRFGGAAQTDEIEYAPSLPTGRRRDVPELRPPSYSAVFYMFGKSDTSPLYAIHDEDALEFAYTLQTTVQNGVPPVRMFSELRGRHLLLIGCHLADWLGRFFLRLSNEKRLSSDDRPKREFLVDRATPEERELTVFLETFSHDSRWYSIAPSEFVAELHRRWTDRNPSSPGEQPASSPKESKVGGIFISYASEDIGAAKRLFFDVQEHVGDVVWFDKSALKPGDDWERQIKGAVSRCDIFVPLLSSITERRTEGYFRLEWHEAAERARKIQGRKFIFPTVIDATFERGMTGYALVPDAFRGFQYTHAPAGQMPPALKDEIAQELKNLNRRLV